MIDDSIIKQVDDNGVYSVGSQYYVNARYYNRDYLFKLNINALFKLMLLEYTDYMNMVVIENRTEVSKSSKSTISFRSYDRTSDYLITFI